MGVLWISRDRDDRRIFLSLKFLIPGFNWVGNISGISFRVFNAFWEFLRLENLTLWGGGGLLEALEIFGVLIFALIRSSPSLEIPSPPLG